MPVGKGRNIGRLCHFLGMLDSKVCDNRHDMMKITRLRLVPKRSESSTTDLFFSFVYTNAFNHIEIFVYNYKKWQTALIPPLLAPPLLLLALLPLPTRPLPTLLPVLLLLLTRPPRWAC